MGEYDDHEKLYEEVVRMLTSHVHQDFDRDNLVFAIAIH